jgi:hypothetical protein
MAIGPDGHLYVSSRFEGIVYRVNADGTFEAFARELGIACGLAFADDGSLYGRPVGHARSRSTGRERAAVCSRCPAASRPFISPLVLIAPSISRRRRQLSDA